MINIDSARGRYFYTKRYTGVDTNGTAINFSDVSVNEVLIHIEGSTSVATLTGDTHTDSAAAVITSDGTWLPPIPKATRAGLTIATVAAPSSTVNVSVLAWGE